MANNLVMSQKERDHLIVIKQVVKGRLSAREAATMLKVTRRHIFRMVKRYQKLVISGSSTGSAAKAPIEATRRN